MHQRRNDSSQNAAGAEGLFEMLFAAIWFIVSYLPFVLIAAIVGVTLFKYAHLSHFVSAIIGFAAGFVCLCGIKALDRLARRLESRMSLWHLPVKAVVVAFVAGPPFALGYVLGASFVAERSIFERLIAGGFVGLVIAGPAYYRVIHDEH